MVSFCKPIIPDMNLVNKYLDSSFKSGYLSNFGINYKRLVERLHAYLKLDDDKEIVLVSSGHTALQASYAIANTKKPLIPDYTFASTLVASFEKPVIVDCDMDGFLITDVEEYYDSLVVVCPLSRIPDLQYYTEICKNKNIPLIIDGASCFGTPEIYNYGDFFCLSFHATKTFPMGEGGAVICSKENAQKIRQYINFGMNEKKEIIMHGTNAKISEYSCAIGLALLDEIEKENGVISARLKNAKIYQKELEEYAKKSYSGLETVYQTFPIYVPSVEKAQNMRNRLKENNIEFIQYYKPLTKKYNAKYLYDTNISLPCHQDVSEKDIYTIINIIKDENKNGR